ncbi:sulfatase family protein [Pelagicoccus albus]|uniref:Sulfatase-like hydrolase/transferase n=1 Tax=Pelagicoccus albus TaxID=415222 RepID=A0A7X1E9Y8_9BACT|nr:sulfatase-like hydrolase/transferase [Pelagicoccus albus]MBC2607939.1 sulfatase-like hydrolase/transferase [Pelagicoccus albus]
MYPLAAKLSILFLLGLACLNAASEQPNIVLIMADDHGRWATGTYGDSRIRTPNMDQLAAEGVRFDAAISPAPVCSPSRASFFTGRIPSQHGVHDFLSEDEPFDKKGRLDGETLLSEKLKKAGYKTGLFGKWHADGEGWKPVRGFDKWLSYDLRAMDWITQYAHSGTVHYSVDGEAVSKTGMQAWFLTESALEFIDSAEGAPFFTCLTYVEPHFPFEGLPERTVSYYRDFASELLPYGDNSWTNRSNKKTGDTPQHEEWVAQYLAAVTLLDEQIGRLQDGLQARGLLENTIIIYVSDHGHMTGQYGLYGKANGSLPLNLTEETLSIPLIISGPREWIRPAQVRSEFVNLCDLHETIVDLAGSDETPKGPGKALTPLLQGERVREWRQRQFAEYGNARMISDGRWKLVRYYAEDPASAPVDHWFDLSNPRKERVPSIGPHQEAKEDFVSQLETYFTRWEEPGKSGRQVWSLPRFNAGEPWTKEPLPISSN